MTQTPNRRILIVDDQEAIREDFKKILLGKKEGEDALSDARAAFFGEDDEDAIKILRMLIEAGADLNAKDDSGETALMYAAYYDDPEAVEVLLKAGAETDIKDEDGKTAYDMIEDQSIRDIFHRYGVFR